MKIPNSLTESVSIETLITLLNLSGWDEGISELKKTHDKTSKLLFDIPPENPGYRELKAIAERQQRVISILSDPDFRAAHEIKE